jgi:hypothetical protein
MEGPVGGQTQGVADQKTIKTTVKKHFFNTFNVNSDSYVDTYGSHPLPPFRPPPSTTPS